MMKYIESMKSPLNRTGSAAGLTTSPDQERSGEWMPRGIDE